MTLGPSAIVVLLAGLGLGFAGGPLEIAAHVVLGLVALQAGFLVGAGVSRIMGLSRLRARKARRAAASDMLAARRSA
jgi:hypothetical protein